MQLKVAVVVVKIRMMVAKSKKLAMWLSKTGYSFLISGNVNS